VNSLPAPGSHIHLIAVCGVGMASLAGLLQSRGYRVSGSDQNVYPPMSTYLAAIGIDVQPGFAPEHLEPRPDLVVVGNAVPPTNPEAQAVLAQSIPYVSFPQALGQFLIGARTSVVVAGTHGKTTTTALAAWVLTVAGLEPGFFVGGVPVNFGSGWKVGAGDHVVIEGDEYDSAFFDKGPKFLHYRPRLVILTSVEFDHADIYNDLDHVKSAFIKLMEIVPADGLVIHCADYVAVNEIAAAAGCQRVGYGDSAAGWHALGLEFHEGRTFFEPHYRGRSEGKIEVGLIGRHNVKNALAVYALGRELGLSGAKLGEGFRTFAGVKRRQEIRGQARGVLLIDDFAHHPTAVGETLEAVRAAYSGRRLWAVFEPRSNTSKRKVFAREFAAALALADRVLMADVYQPERVPDQDRLSVESVVDRINRLCGDKRARKAAGAAEIAAVIGRDCRPGDVILVMSNGGFDNVHDKILQALAG
jgi:UDP-N-acetylmuramate: L-alanyl-gamma-D-glutamyl-meso-diaminopimelate ligase